MGLYKNSVLCFLAGVFLLASCNRDAVKQKGNSEPEYRKITAEEAHEMMANNSDFILLDVRTTAEYSERRIPGAVNISNTEIMERAEKEIPGKDTLILVYCASGGRSAGASKELVSLGYYNVYDFGGLNAWPYETTSE